MEIKRIIDGVEHVIELTQEEETVVGQRYMEDYYLKYFKENELFRELLEYELKLPEYTVDEICEVLQKPDKEAWAVIQEKYSEDLDAAETYPLIELFPEGIGAFERMCAQEYFRSCFRPGFFMEDISYAVHEAYIIAYQKQFLNTTFKECVDGRLLVMPYNNEKTITYHSLRELAASADSINANSAFRDMHADFLFHKPNGTSFAVDSYLLGTLGHIANMFAEELAGMKAK